MAMQSWMAEEQLQKGAWFGVRWGCFVVVVRLKINEAFGWEVNFPCAICWHWVLLSLTYPYGLLRARVHLAEQEEIWTVSVLHVTLKIPPKPKGMPPPPALPAAKTGTLGIATAPPETPAATATACIGISRGSGDGHHI